MTTETETLTAAVARLTEERDQALAWHTVASAEREEWRARADRAEYALGKLSDVRWLDDYDKPRGGEVLVRLITHADDTAAAGRIGALAQMEVQIAAVRARLREAEAEIAEHERVERERDQALAVIAEMRERAMASMRHASTVSPSTGTEILYREAQAVLTAIDAAERGVLARRGERVVLARRGGR